MKRRVVPVVLVVVAAAGLAAAVAWLLWGPRHQAAGGTAPAAQRAPEAPAATDGNTLRFQPGAAQLAYLKIEPAAASAEPLIEALPGRVAYDENRTARLKSPLPGRVKRIVVQLGQAVTAGQPLAWIESPDFAQAVAEVRRAELEVRQKRLVFDRARLLFEGEVMSRKEFEAAETDLREAEVEQARTQRRLAAIGQAAPGSDSGEFALRAPLAGLVTERAISPGAQVDPAADKPLFVISDPARLWVVVDVPEQHLGVFAPGQAVSVEVDAFPGRSFGARVIDVGAVLDALTRRVQVRAALDNPERLLRGEMFARVVPLAGSGRERVRLPNAAVLTVGVASFVFVEKAPGVFERRKVTASLQGRDTTWLSEGVAPGERVVSAGALLLNSELEGN